MWGREDELAAVAAFVEDDAAGTRALAVEGEPGIGKSTLWRAAVARASGRRTVLRAEPAAAEAALSYSGLGDLFGRVAAVVLDALFAPQRAALEVALLRRSADGAPPDARAVAAAVLGALSALAASSPVLVAIDDVQWLDASSLAALAYAGRRLRTEPVAFLLTRRTGAARDELVPEEHVLSLGPLPREPFRALLRERAGPSLAPGRLERLYAWAGGNPLHGLELAQARTRGPHADLTALVAGRVAAVSSDARTALLAVALASNPDHGVLLRALGAGAGAAVAELERADLVVSRGARLRAAHPLVAQGAVETAGPAELREVHRRLASAVDGQEEQARHLALGADGPDASVAATVASAAGTAAESGAPAAAAELYEEAARLTEDDHDRARLLLAAGRQSFLAADFPRGERLLEAALAGLPRGPEYAEALVAFGIGVGHDVPRAHALFAAAIAEAGSSDAVRASALAFRSVFLGVLALRPLPGFEDASEALRLAQRVGDPDLVALALASLAWSEALLGRRSTVEERLTPPVRDALERQRVFVGARRPLLAQRIWRGELSGVHDELRALQAGATVAGDEESAAAAAVHLAEYELRAGDWRAAEAHVATLAAYAELAPPIRPVADCYAAAVAARLGDVERAVAVATRGREVAAALGDVLFDTLNRATLGFVRLSQDRYAEACAWLDPIAELCAERGLGDPGQLLVLPDLVEALAGAGRAADARPHVQELARAAEEQEHPYAAFTAARCRAIVAAADGELDDALAALAGAPPLAMPFEQARSQLVLGKTLLRARRRSEARAALGQAASAFESLGAACWVARARGELARLGGRKPSDALTPAQLRVARLVAEGGSNKTVAAALFISENTVETHLRHVFAKLGVRSRTELARRLLAAERELDHGDP